MKIEKVIFLVLVLVSEYENSLSRPAGLLSASHGRGGAERWRRRGQRLSRLQGLGMDPLPWPCLVAACAAKGAAGPVRPREIAEETRGARRAPAHTLGPLPTLSSCLRGDAKCKRGGGSPPAPKAQESPPALCMAVLASGRASFRGTCRPALLRFPRALVSRRCRRESPSAKVSKSGCY